MSQSYSPSRYTESRLLQRSCESLIGIASGLIADGELNDKEILFLSTWLAQYPELSECWPGDVLFSRIRSVLADGVITQDERDDLLKTLVDLVGGNFAEDGAVSTCSTALPLDLDAEIYFAGRSFCFTGQFVSGSRARCEGLVESAGGCIQAVTKKLDFLVIGELASRDWKFSSHGRKIEAAIASRKSGGHVKIVGEAQWLKALELGS